MEYDEILKGVMEMNNCCSLRANTIIVNKVNNGKKEELERDIQTFYNKGGETDG